jgi:hypothetical protein
MAYRETNAGSCEESLKKLQVLSAVTERSLSRRHRDPAATACSALHFAKLRNFFLLPTGILQRLNFKNLQSNAKQNQKGLMASTAMMLLTSTKPNVKIK